MNLHDHPLILSARRKDDGSLWWESQLDWARRVLRCLNIHGDVVSVSATMSTIRVETLPNGRHKVHQPAAIGTIEYIPADVAAYVAAHQPRTPKEDE